MGVTSFLDEAIAPLTSPTCRARFGDRQCKKNLLAHQKEVKVSAVKANELAFAELRGLAAHYAFGTLRWLSGANCGLSSSIFYGRNNVIGLAETAQQKIMIDDRALLTGGCDKNFSTCRDRFNNQINFRGEPYLPGNDLLTRYPGA